MDPKEFVAMTDLITGVVCFFIANYGTAALYAAFFVWRMGEHELAKRIAVGGLAVVVASLAMEFWEHALKAGGSSQSLAYQMFRVCNVLWIIMSITFACVPCMFLKPKQIRPSTGFIALCFIGYFIPPLLSIALVKAIKMPPRLTDQEGFAKSVDITMKGEEI